MTASQCVPLNILSIQYQVIGRIVLGGPECEGTALTHWEEIQKNPRRPIAQWHKLTGPQ